MQSWPGTDVSIPVEVEEGEGDTPEQVEEGEGHSMEEVLRLLGELEIAVGEVGADGRRAGDAVAAAAASAVAGSEQRAPSLAVEAAAPAGVAEEKEAVQGAAEAGAAPPLPGASVLPADDGAGGAAASGVQEPGLPATLPSPPPPTAACASIPALHNPVGAASTDVATSPAVHVLSPRGLTSAAPRPLEPPAGLALPPAGPPPASGTQASEDPVAAAGATQAQVPQRAPVEAGAGLGARPVGLSVADVPRYSGVDYHWLHKEARAALNNLYATGLQEAVAPAFAWREYVCAHPRQP